MRSYWSAHDRVFVARGNAGLNPCTCKCGCQKQARQWAHIHDTDPDNTDNYMAMCYSCHQLYDVSSIASVRERHGPEKKKEETTMKDEERSELKAGKGVRLPVTGGILDKIINALELARNLYEKCDDPSEFMAQLELEEASHTSYDRGRTHFEADNRYIKIRTGSGEEFRMTFSLTNQGQFTLDFRGWFTPAGQG